MSILDSMRSGTDSTFMQVVLVLVVVSFIFWYVAPQGDRASVVAVVNGVTIMDTKLSRQYQSTMRAWEFQLGRSLTEEERRQVRDDLRDRLIRDEALRQEAVRLGLTISGGQIAREIHADPRFRHEGSFDERMLEQSLRRMGYSTRADFEAELRDALLRDKLQRLVMQGAYVSEPALREIYIDSSTLLDLEYVRLVPEAVVGEIEVDEAQLATFLTERSDEVEQAYEADFQRLYNIPDQVRLGVIRLPVRGDGQGIADLRQRLAEVRAEIEGGADFAEMARRYSEHPSAAAGGDMGLEPIDILSPEVSGAVAGLDEGELSQLLVEDDQVRLFKVLEQEEGRVVPLEEVREEIALRLIRGEEGPRRARGVAEALQVAWAAESGAPVELLLEYGLELDRTGPFPISAGVGPGGPPPGLIEEARDLASGTVMEVHEEQGVLWVAAVRERTDPDMEQFELDRTRIEQQVLLGQRAVHWEGFVDSVVGRARVR